MAYPNSLDSFTTKTDGIDDVMAADINSIQSAIVAVENALGIEIRKGWLPAGVVWTRIDDRKFSAPGDLTAFYGVGTKFKCIAGGVIKQGYFAAVSYTSPNTTVTTVGDLLTGAITEPYYSYHVIPGGFKFWFDLSTPNWTTTGTPFTNQPVTNVAKFCINGRLMQVYVKATCHATSGGTGVFIATFDAGQLPLFANAGTGSAFNNTQSIGGSAWITTVLQNVFRLSKYDGTTLAANSEVFTASSPCEI